MVDHLTPPHGGDLVSLLAAPPRKLEINNASRSWPSWDLTPRQLCDLELLLNGGFSPLRGFMTRPDYEGVCSSMRLKNGLVWPMPIVLDVTEEFAKSIGQGATVALRDPEGVVIAALHVEDVWRPDRDAEVQAVYGTRNSVHPGVAQILKSTHPWYVGGQVEGIQLPSHYDYRSLRLTPSQLRDEFARLGWRRVVAFQTRNPMHRAHQELTLRAAKEMEANLLIHPSVGMTKPGDVEYYVRVRCYQALLSRYAKDQVRLSLLPLAMRMGGPREAVWHAIIRKNYGCTHLIVGRDHAGPGSDENGKPFYGPYAAQELLRKYQAEIGITMVPFSMMVYLADQDVYVPDNEVPKGERTLNISGTELRRRLSEGREIPSWFTFPDVAQELQRSYPARNHQGLTVMFTGLPGSGKSTIANVLRVKFLEMGGRPVTFLDDDVVQRHLSSELGSSSEGRDMLVRRIGYVASEITKNGGIALCTPVAPSDRIRKEIRAMVQPAGGFVLVYLSTPREVCERRDRKGTYVKSQAEGGSYSASDSYEAPTDADVVIDTSDLSPEESAQSIFLHLEKLGFFGLENRGSKAFEAKAAN